MQFFDSHIHLDDRKYNHDRDKVITRARAAGVESFLNPGATYRSSLFGVEFSKKDKHIFCALGIHPHDAEDVNDKTFADFKKIASEGGISAIGEVGLDYHYNFSPPDVQRDVFRKFLKFAHDLSLPVIIHSREANEDVYRIMKEEKAEELGGVLHCYSGTQEYASRFLDMGLYIGITGVVTYPKAEGLRQIVKKTPLDRILAETDGPYLAPIPHRGQRNEPSYIPLIVKEIAKVKEIALEKCAEQILKNTFKCYRLSYPTKL